MRRLYDTLADLLADYVHHKREHFSYRKQWTVFERERLEFEREKRKRMFQVPALVHPLHAPG